MWKHSANRPIFPAPTHAGYRGPTRSKLCECGSILPTAQFCHFWCRDPQVSISGLLGLSQCRAVKSWPLGVPPTVGTFSVRAEMDACVEGPRLKED
uniref:Uncharacterized protein n=1 Tax=Varanus komodoensis TaxID=61221 RepID=A0A8D2Q7U1_VARKO